MSDYKQTIVNYIRANAKPADKFGHQPRLYRLACGLAEGRSFDDDVVFGACWMHDLGVFVGHRPEDPKALAAWDMIAYAECVVPGLLEQFGFPPSKIPAVILVIRSHQPSCAPSTFEGVLVRDADILEQLGATGICRTLAKVGRDTRFHCFNDAIKALKRNVEELPRQLALDSSRRLAEPRARVLRQFIESAAIEAQNGVF
jgi:uncharacterized protein